MQTGLGFWASKTLLSAVELGVFTELARGPLDAETLRRRLGLHPRSARDFFDALVAMKFLERRDGQYSNTPETDFYLDRNKPTYACGMLEMCNARLYAFWGSLTEALRTGSRRTKGKTGGNFFGAIYRTPETLERFLSGMTGHQPRRRRWPSPRSSPGRSIARSRTSARHREPCRCKWPSSIRTCKASALICPR